MITIDGVRYGFKTRITRTEELKASDISGILLDRTIFNDILGTYLQYDVALEFPAWDQDNYAEFHDLLTDPVSEHTFVLPYDQDELTVVGSVEPISDDYIEMPNGKKYWTGTRFAILATAPHKQMTLGQILARGRSPLPPLSEVSPGDIYTYTSTGWVKTVYTNADEVYY